MTGNEEGRIEPYRKSEKDALKPGREQTTVSKEIDREKRRAEKLKNDEAEKRVEEIDQRINQRKGFHWFAMIVIAVPVIVSSLAFIFLVWQGRVTDTIAAAFFASVVAEVIGLSYIMGNYFYPRRGIEKNEQE